MKHTATRFILLIIVITVCVTGYAEGGQTVQEISISQIEGIRIGQAENAEAGTGCTVFICEDGMRAGLDVRGGGPASRESQLLNPLMSAQTIHAIVLAGGSAYGLGTANGVMSCLEERGVGYDTGYALVPLVAQADIYDLSAGDPAIRPDAAMGYEAARIAFEAPNYRDGNYGVGCGATVGKIAGMDTCIAVLAGLICVPALFSFGIEPTAGPSLIFITLPNLFNAMGGFGIAFGLLFMICVFFAGFTSNLGGSEALVASISDSTPKLSRRWIATIVVVAQFLFSIPFTFSFGSGWLSKITILGLGFFDFFCLVSDICLCLGAIGMLAYVIFRMGFKKFQEAANEGATGKIKVYGWMKWYLYIVYPVLLIAVLYFLIRAYF